MSTKNTPEVDELATGEQVGHIHDLGAKRLRALRREQAQAIITNGGVYQAAFGKMIDEVLERVMGTITRRVRVNRGRTLQEAIDVTGRRKYVNSDVLATMPRGEGEEVEMEYFHLGRYVSNAEVAAEFESRGLVPDPVALAADNEADPAFADSHPNGTQWQMPDEGWAYLAFDRWNDERYVDVNRYDVGWDVHWRFGGRRK